jgi:hypothetical protein
MCHPALSDLNSYFLGADMQSCRPQLLDKYQMVCISGVIEFICDWRIFSTGRLRLIKKNQMKI